MESNTDIAQHGGLTKEHTFQAPLKVSSDNPAEKTTMVAWTGDLKTQYSESDGSPESTHLPACLQRTASLQFELRGAEAPSLAYLTTISRALLDAIGLKAESGQVSPGKHLDNRSIGSETAREEATLSPINEACKGRLVSTVCTNKGHSIEENQEINECQNPTESDDPADHTGRREGQMSDWVHGTLGGKSMKTATGKISPERPPVVELIPQGFKGSGQLGDETKVLRERNVQERQNANRLAYEKERDKLRREIEYQTQVLGVRKEEGRQQKKLARMRDELRRIRRAVEDASDSEASDHSSGSSSSDEIADDYSDRSHRKSSFLHVSRSKGRRKSPGGRLLPPPGAAVPRRGIDPSLRRLTGPIPKERQPPKGQGPPQGRYPTKLNQGPKADDPHTEKEIASDPPEEEDDCRSDDPAWAISSSNSKAEWEHQKSVHGEANESLDKLMNTVGLESVKEKIRQIKNLAATASRQELNIREEKFGAVFIGNPGTGKTIVAGYYASFLRSLNASFGDCMVETTGPRLVWEGTSLCRTLITGFGPSGGLASKGGVFLVEDAHKLLSRLQVLDYLLTEMDRLRGRVAFVFAGHGKEMESLLGVMPRLQSRIPFVLKFEDFSDAELLEILVAELRQKFSRRMKVEGGPRGLYMRIVVRRIARGRGQRGFGNAREIQSTLFRVQSRQATRLAKERKEGEEGDAFFLKKEDLIGPPPSDVLRNSKAWQSLQKMIGLQSVKEAVQTQIQRLQLNYDRELAEQPLVECSLNKVFLGNPGTGKTTIAKYYGQVLAEIGLLSKGEVVVKNPAMFVGKSTGHSEANTRAILESSRGKVLIIDEAHMLEGTGDVNKSADVFRTAVVDTLVAEIKPNVVEDRCILLLGYKERMVSMFQKMNQALGRRFPLASAFEFHDYTDEELRQILELKLTEQGFGATDEAKKVVTEALSRARNHRNFGNAGEIDILLDRAKDRLQRRYSASPASTDPSILEAQDIDADFDRGERAAASISDLFKDFIGCDNVIEQLQGYERVAKNMKRLDMDPRTYIPFSFLFRGPPGTGKTTTARRMGQVYYELGFLATNDVEQCSPTDLIGEYVGQTGPKTKRVFQKALGKVLLIDEAYMLADSKFGKEAVAEMLNLLSKDEYQNKLVTILAGYDYEISFLLSKNPGITSRFPEVLDFQSLPPKECCNLLFQCMTEQKLNPGDLQSSTRIIGSLEASFNLLSRLPSWGNARDIQTIAKGVFNRIMQGSISTPDLVVGEDVLFEQIDVMIAERVKRAAAARDLRTGTRLL